jgi:hypothetical protein
VPLEPFARSVRSWETSELVVMAADSDRTCEESRAAITTPGPRGPVFSGDPGHALPHVAGDRGGSAAASPPAARLGHLDDQDLVELLGRLAAGHEEQADLLKQILAAQSLGAAEPEVLTVDEAAGVLRVGRSAARRFLERNDLIVSVEGRRRVSRSALLEVLRPRARKGTQAVAGTRRRKTGSDPVFALALD